VSSLTAQTKPLIMRHADSLSVSRKVGYLILKGHVYFVHDSAQFKTERAVWNRDVDMVQFDGGFLFTHPGGFVQASSGNYQKKTEIASATGNVIAKDSAGTYALFGEHLIYDRKNEILTLPLHPRLQQYEVQKDSTIDTLTIVAEQIIYKKADEYAEAFKNVKLTQKDLTATCDTAYLDKKNSWLALTGSPKFFMDGYELSGDSIFVVIDQESRSLKSALVIRNAHGVQEEPGKDSLPGKHVEAEGDTLYAEFKDQKISRLYVNLNARGFFYESDLKNYRNTLDGNRLDISFKDGKLDSALVSGNAASTYFYVKNDRSIAGKNEAAGDTISVTFKAGEISRLKMLGDKTLASGRYYNLEKELTKKTDSTTVEEEKPQ
jgi:lipopolysaccharide export system protein LptA